jgi:hypothetical protein
MFSYVAVLNVVASLKFMVSVVVIEWDTDNARS